jgi:hypothetical protein
MADEGFTSAGPSEPLAASIAEQLRAKAEREQTSGAAPAKAHDERARERVERGAGYGLTPALAALAVLVLPRGLRWTVGLPIVLMLLLRDVPAR